MCGSDRDTGNTDRNKGYRVIEEKLLGCYYPTDDTDKCGCHHLFWRSN